MMALNSMTIADASDALNRREISCVELVGAVLAQAKAINPIVNAFVRIDEELALAQAKVADILRARGQTLGPLHGIPMAYKDMFHRAGLPSSYGTTVKATVPERSATTLSRLDAAGAIQIGALNMSAFAVGPTGLNNSVGNCLNPWNTERITGGSSSGSGAAVAVHAAFATLGTDTAGSVRLPAAFCGVTGLKPTYGRVSRAGVLPLSTSLDTIGPLARSVKDVALVMNALAGADVFDAGSAHVDVPDYVRRIDEPVRGLRIGVPTNFFSEGLDPEVRQSIDASLQVLKDLGCEIIPVSIPDLSAADAAAALIVSCEASSLHQEMMREQRDGYTVQFRMRMERAFSTPAPTYLDALRFKSIELARFLKEVFTKVDVLHAPVAPCLTPTVAESNTESGDRLDEIVGRLVKFNRPINFLGLPALALPVGFSSDAMPLSMQLIGRPFAEQELLRLGHAYQTATDWHKQFPALARQDK
jgi:aspartyl-tRNA(Asn)/glutamyl-tRNA(Gln) amidotransferase subunit A